MLRHVIKLMIIGFLVPVFWGILSFVLFNAKESAWTTLYWYLVYVTCPFWLLPTSTATTILMPFLNALLYGAIAFYLLRSQRLKRQV